MIGKILSIAGALRKGQLSVIFREMKLALVDMEGSVSRSDIYFTNIETEEKVQLCMTPEKIDVRTGAKFRSYNIVESGEVKLPKGEQLAQVSWKGLLPGAQMTLYQNTITLKAWEDPMEIIKVFDRWREDGAKLKLLITQTPINLDVYLEGFDYEMSGGVGDYKYSIDVVAAKELQILTVAEADARKNDKAELRAKQIQRRAMFKSKLGTRITKINGMWAAVKLLTGKGGFGDWMTVCGAYNITDPTALAVGSFIFGRK